MTRSETIEQQAKSYTLAVFDELEDFSDVTQAYIDGAEWMQETMIEKAREWIISNMPKYVKAHRLDVFINNEDMANDFKQAMEK